ncbi:HAD-like protein [Xylariaceae sp. FL1651]|nr:HAD-like protein [Xylariaceae sp. FL1651]
MAKTAPRRFAPLNGRAGHGADLPKLRGIIFDVDGTLCLPQNYMFPQMRSILGIPASIDILDHIASLPTPAEREGAMDAIRGIEREAMASQIAQPGLTTLMSYLQAQGVRKAICTRNFEQPVAHLLSKFLVGVEFSPIVTRDHRPPKPDPAGLLFIARSWGLVRDVSPDAEAKAGVSPDADADAGVHARGQRLQTTGALLEAAAQGSDFEREGARGPKYAQGTTRTNAEADGNTQRGEGEEVGDASALIMVGDSIDDMTAGRRAGAATVLLMNDENAHLAEHAHTDLVIRRLDDLVKVLEEGFVGREIPISSR